MVQEFLLDPRLAGDTDAVLSLPLSELLLMNDARFAWLIMVPRRADIAELIDLSMADRALLVEEIATVSQALKAVTGCDKLNVATLGNAVRQLHIHIVARFTTDSAWPGPVWGSGEAVDYQAEDRHRLIHRIRAALPT
jgi:diadenosine tetraphosphate (Ap4A) HIT family hydrolase